MTKAELIAIAKKEPNTYFAVNFTEDGETVKKLGKYGSKEKAQFYAKKYHNGWTYKHDEDFQPA